MSMMSEQTRQLRECADYIHNRGSLDPIQAEHELREAADTIEELAAKLHTANMERSSAYYGGGWISVEDRLPENDGVYLVTTVDKGQVQLHVFNHNGNSEEYWKRCNKAWMPLPKPYEDKHISRKESEANT